MSDAVRIEAASASTSVATRLRVGWTAVAVGALALGAGVYYSICGLLLHYSFHSYGWDLGIFDQVTWSIAHGHAFHYSFRDMQYLGDHFQPVLILLAPLVFLKFGPAPLLVVQGLAFGIAVVPLFAATRRLGGTVAAWGLSAAYVLSLGPARAVSYDFHPECFAPALAFTALWALTARRPGVFVAACVALLPVKEDMTFLVLGLCWVSWLGFGERKPAQWVALGTVAYLVVISLAVMPLFNHGNSNPLIERYPYLGHTPRSIFLHAITRPDLIVDHLWNSDTPRTLGYLFAGTGFLALLRPKLLLPIVLLLLPPMLAVNDQQRLLELHYGVVPYAFTFVVGAMVLESGYFDLLWRRVWRPAPPHPQEKRRTGDTPAPPATGLRPFALPVRLIAGLKDWVLERPAVPPPAPLSSTATDKRSAGEERPGLAGGSGVGVVREGRFVLALSAVVVVLAFAVFAWESPLPPSFAADSSAFEVDHHSDVAETFVDLIPSNAVVSAQANFVPHLSERYDIYEFPRITPKATFVLIDDGRGVPGYDAPAFADCRAKLPAFGFALARAEDGIELWSRSAADASALGSDGCG
ncbi:MAG: DUF2079 domain-containing protein [Chloroflexota bacterium]